MEYKDNTILIVPSTIKKYILLTIDKLVNIKIYTINELIKKLFFDYDEQAIYYIKKKYNVNCEIAKKYIDNMYYIKDIDNEKIKFLKDLKQELIDNNLLITNSLFKESLKGKTLEFISISQTLYNQKIIEDLKELCEVKVIEEENHNYTHPYRRFKTLDEEVVYVASEICHLVNNGIDINKIFITNLSDEHHLAVTKYFALFNLPFNIKNSRNLFGTPLVKKFIKEYNSDITITLNSIKESISNVEEESIYNALINIINKYYFVSDYEEVKDMIITDIKNTKVNNSVKNNCVREVNFLDYPFKDDDYVFLLHLNQGIMPKIYKDENYLSDKIMEELNLDTAPSKNKLEKERTINKIKNVKNLYISYIDASLTNTYYPSTIIEEMHLEMDNSNYNPYIYSNSYNKIKLASLMDKYKKYNTITDDLKILNSNYTLNTYDNNYKYIDKDNLLKYLNDSLYLSYTSLNNYYKCGFKYYLSNILKLNIYEDTFLQIIGDIFHEVLEKYFKEETDFEKLYEDVTNRMEYSYTIKDRFFLRKLKHELKFVIETIENQNNYSNLKKELYERKIVTNIEGNISIKFSGKIDKLKYLEKDNETIIAIIDYKTGNPELDLNKVIYGLDMQLPVYIYLAKNCEELKNIKVAGFYLQKILNSEVQADNKHTYEELKKDNLKLQGYSNEHFKIIGEFDTSYTDSEVIKSLKTSGDSFRYKNRILSSSQMDKLIEIVEKNIKRAAEDITNAEFPINPKAINNNNLGCEFCKYKDICYMTEKNIVNLPRHKDLDFLGGDNNAQMD